ncbi:hypothetical protein IPL68_00855 [Candidatus Saccharibacteria bacterium]|nr:MAG: hypothetical protein IPL68_00855 [Candidatus Saccharibacteria bacterium]
MCVQTQHVDSGYAAGNVSLVDPSRFDPNAIHARFVLDSVDHVMGVLGASAVGWDAHVVQGYDIKNGAVNKQTTPLWVGYIIDATYADGEELKTKTVVLSETDFDNSFVPKVLATLKQRAAEHTYGLIPDDKRLGSTAVIFGENAKNTSFAAWLEYTKEKVIPKAA